MAMMLRWPAWSVAVCCCAPLACYAGIDEDSYADGGDETQSEAGEGEDGSSDGGGEGGPAEEAPAPAPRTYRLTHAQWDNTAQDLLGLPGPTGLTDLLRDDPKIAGYVFDNDATSLEVDEALWTGYRIAAGELAQTVTEDPDLLAPFVDVPGDTEAERIDSFVRSFGTRAYRRPLTEAEVAALADLFNAGSGLYSGVQDPFVAGVRHVIEAVLQSPYFLYRIETSEAVVDGVIPLSDYELASRLSYFLWNTMPDAELFDAAEAGELETAADIAAQAERMLDDPRAADMVVRFHHQLLEVEKMETISPSELVFDVPENLPELAIEEHEHFIRDVVFGNGGGLIELLTSSQTMVESELAAIYGVAGVTGSDFVEVDLDPTQRRGVFTQLGFLAANASSFDPDPIHRGVFLAKRMACHTIAAPPDGVPPLPPLGEDQTNRERVEAHTSGNPCASCHGPLINPFGFPYESYDALGAWRTVDNGQPVDTATMVLLDGQQSVSGAVELAEVMAASEQVHECYARHWLEYATGRNYVFGDAPTVSRLGGDSLAEEQSMRELLVALTTSVAFSTRAAEELQ